MKPKINDIVTITVYHPDGVPDIMKGQVGIITEITRGGLDYCVRTQFDEFWYGKDQFRPATEMEIKSLVIKLLT